MYYRTKDEENVIYLFIYMISNSLHETVVLKKLPVAQMAKKFPTFYEPKD